MRNQHQSEHPKQPKPQKTIGKPRKVKIPNLYTSEIAKQQQQMNAKNRFRKLLNYTRKNKAIDSILSLRLQYIDANGKLSSLTGWWKIPLSLFNRSYGKMCIHFHFNNIKSSKLWQFIVCIAVLDMIFFFFLIPTEQYIQLVHNNYSRPSVSTESIQMRTHSLIA